MSIKKIVEKNLSFTKGHKYRIIEHNQNGEIYYCIQEKCLLFWVSLNRDEHRAFLTLEDAYEAIHKEQYKQFCKIFKSSRNVIKPDQNILNKMWET